MATVSPLQVVAQYENQISESDLVLVKQLGLPNKIIGQCLGISGAAVRMKVTRIAIKLGVENRTAIVIKALELGLVTPSQLSYRRFDGKTDLSGTAN